MFSLKKKSLVVCALIPLFLFGCSETQTTPQASAPELPPAESMALDLSFFSGNNAPGVQDAAAQTKLNFLNAAVRAAFLNVAVVTILTPPHLAFAAAIHTIPSKQSDGSYLWIYTYSEDGMDYQIRLNGAPTGDKIDWELSYVLPGQSAEVWFYGQSHQENDEGYWIFKDPEAAGKPDVFRIDWNSMSATDAFLELENIHVGHEEEGDRLTYSVDGTDALIEFEDFSTSEVFDIQWNEATGAGSLKMPEYNNGERACWNENQEDVDCAAAAASVVASLKSN